MKIKQTNSDGTEKYILLGKDKRNAERLAKGEMYACPSCGDPLEFDAEMCENCGAFIDKETRQLRTQVSDAELQKNINDSKARFNKAKAVMVTGGILLALSVFFSGNLIFILISAAVLIVGIYGTSAEMALVKRQLNRAVIPQILSEYFEDVVYNPEGTVPLDQVSEAFWGEYNRHMGSDYIKCRYHGIDIEMSDLTLEKVTHRTVTDEKGNTKQEEEVETLLHGQWMIFDFHKQLSANVRLLANTKKRKDGIETENMAFNNKFRISSSSPHDAFYVLTPHMMEHILQVTANAGGNVDFMFMMDGKLHLAMHTHKNHFETGDLKNTSLDALRDKFRGEIDFILSVVNELKDELLSL